MSVGKLIWHVTSDESNIDGPYIMVVDHSG